MLNLHAYFVQQFAYIRWADQRCIDAVASVPAGNVHHDFGFSFRTVHKTVLHMVGAQHIWVGRWQGDSSRSFPTDQDLPTLADVRVRWAAVHDEVKQFVERQTDETLQQRIEYIRNKQPHSGVLWQLINHCFDHSNYHRGQLNSLIKLAGGTPAGTMYVDYCRRLEEDKLNSL